MRRGGHGPVDPAQLKFRPWLDQGWAAQCPNGGQVFIRRQEAFAFPLGDHRVTRYDTAGVLVAHGERVRDVCGEVN